MATKKAPRKKRPAKKKAKAKKRAVSIQTRAPQVIPEQEIPDETNATKEFLRYAAGLHYTTDLNGITLAQLCEHPMFKTVSLKTMERWSVKDGWGDRRREVMERWRVQIEARVGNKLIQTKIALVEQMEKIQNHLFKRLVPLDHDYDPGDWVHIGKSEMPIQVCKVCGATQMQHFDPFVGVSGDKAVDALLKLVKVREEMAEAILQVTATPGYGLGHTTSAGAHGGPVGLERPKISTEEARSAARAILQQRRQNVLGPMKGDDDAST